MHPPYTHSSALTANVLGFWGGIVWNIAVARVCQLYPRAVPAVLLEKFFRYVELFLFHSIAAT